MTIPQEYMEYAVYALAFFILLQFLYNYSRDKDSSKKIHVLAKSVGELTRQMYESEMRINEKIRLLQEAKEGVSHAELETLIDINVTDKLIAVNQSIMQIQQEMHAFNEEFAGRIIRLEGNLKEVSKVRTAVGGADDQKIFQLYKEGKDIEMIAKELRISKPEVEFALKLADLR